MIILGVDWGERRLGLAFSNGQTAAPLKILTVNSEAAAVAQITRICQELQAERLVLGLPTDQDGQPGQTAERVLSFGERLRGGSGVEVVFWDEALSSREAKAALITAGRGKKFRRQEDAAAAAVILQGYLDAHPSVGLKV